MQFDEIGNVEHQELHSSGGEGVTVQLPEWHSQTLALAANLEPGESLLIGGPEFVRAGSVPARGPTSLTHWLGRLGLGPPDKELRVTDRGQLYLLITPTLVD